MKKLSTPSLKLCAMLFSQKLPVAIWGIGVTGSALVKFFLQRGHKVIIIDKEKNDSVFNFIKMGLSFYFEESVSSIITMGYVLIPSPGIKIDEKILDSGKFLTELDCFFYLWKGKTIAVTGSVGKTSIATFTYQLLSAMSSAPNFSKKIRGKKIFLGGNIGIPLFSIFDSVYDLAIIEVSSIQLRYTKIFSPNYVLWSNLYKNHLDMHEGSFDFYVLAKARLLMNRASGSQYMIFGETVVRELNRVGVKFSKRNLFVVTDESNPDFKKGIRLKNDGIYLFDKKMEKRLLPKSSIPKCSYLINWKFIASIGYLMGLSKEKLIKFFFKKVAFLTPEHRLEWCGKIGKIDFYNDSKATIMESVEEACKDLIKRYSKIVVLVGGLSKGVNRLESIVKLTNYVTVIFFGMVEEYLSLSTFSDKISFVKTMEEGVDRGLALFDLNSAGAILLSPGGSSFDLYKSYQERGTLFKEYVKKINSRVTSVKI